MPIIWNREPREKSTQEMSDEEFHETVARLSGVDRATLRKNAYYSRHLDALISSNRFLIEYAKATGQEKKLPPAVWLEEQQNVGHFKFLNEKYKIDLREFLISQTRHGHAEIDLPIEPEYGALGVQDTGDCVATVPLRNIFVFGNLNIPLIRFDPLLFVQDWVATFLQPKFIFRGQIACPVGAFGLAVITAEVHGCTSVLKQSSTCPFKQGHDESKGKFIPFEVATPDYTFRPNLIYLSMMVYHVEVAKRPLAGMRIANCTVQCVLPDQIVPLRQEDSNYMPTSHTSTYPVEYMTSGRVKEDPDYVNDLRESFYSVIRNEKLMRQELTERREEEIDAMMTRNLLEDTIDTTDQRNKRPEPDLEGAPEHKRHKS